MIAGVAYAIRLVFEQPGEGAAQRQLHAAIDTVAPRFPRVAALLTDAGPDVLDHCAFPEAHCRQIRATNRLERLNNEIKRRTGVVGILPDRQSVMRLGGMILAEQ